MPGSSTSALPEMKVTCAIEGCKRRRDTKLGEQCAAPGPGGDYHRLGAEHTGISDDAHRAQGFDLGHAHRFDESDTLRKRRRFERGHGVVGDYRARLVMEEADIFGRGREMRKLAVKALGIQLFDVSTGFAHRRGDGGQLAGKAEIDLPGEMENVQTTASLQLLPAADRVLREVHIEGMIIS